MSAYSQIQESLKNYADRFFFDWLKMQGFTSLKQEGLQWYRMVGDNVVQSLHFCN